MLKDRTAAELADALEIMERHPHNTGGLSQLDGATLAFSRYPGVGEKQQAFTDARQAHLRSYDSERDGYSGEAWGKAMQAARELAAALRPLGDTRIAHCTRQARWGTCELPLDDDGECRSTLGHTD
ncbi:hypothetical protein [Streptomyces phytophilus]|uniref:hypothetical protein n=1 Tax=Streptomyces phytophilus TaxID=722715 RepID=UPI0015F100A9|nr:hypothetical protein [Streptomyces phytophilus]